MRLGIAADHGGFELKERLVEELRTKGHEVVDFGAHEYAPTDDYPDVVLPLAQAVARGEVERGVAICGSGVGACVAANKVPGVRAALITDAYSAHQGVEDDNMNIMCLGGRVTCYALAWDLMQTFLGARFKGEERFRRRLAKIAALEAGESVMKANPLLELSKYGQSIWLDYISRQMILNGDLEKLIKEDGLRGVTSNPDIFDKAISGSNAYDKDIRTMAREGRRVTEIYEALTVADVQMAADLFRPLFDRLDGQDGFVSLEVNPHLAHDTHGTISEARRLWEALARPNVFIKVPATREGLPAIKQLTSEGINVNVTLLFGLPRYREVAEAYINGLIERAAQGRPLNRVTSVASFFLSRIDVLLDPQLEKIAAAGGPRGRAAQSLIGEVAIASAKVAYDIYHEIFGGERFQSLVRQGARPQRLLWASTSTKNPSYPDVKYVEPLIGAHTINTLPLKTIAAYRDHGDPAPRLTDGLDRAASILQRLPEVDIDLNAVTQQLEDEGVEKFNKPYDALLRTLEGKMREAESGGDS